MKIEIQMESMDGILFEVQYAFYKGSPMRWSGPLAGPEEPAELCDFSVYLLDFAGLKTDITELLDPMAYDRLYQQVLEDKLYGGEYE